MNTLTNDQLKTVQPDQIPVQPTPTVVKTNWVPPYKPKYFTSPPANN